jgi:transposase
MGLQQVVAAYRSEYLVEQGIRRLTLQRRLFLTA